MRRVARVVLHSDYTLSRAGRVLLLYSLLIAALLVLYTFSQEFILLAIFIHAMTVGFVYAAGPASYLADELAEGRAQLYLAAGLRRLEYLASWMLSLIVFPTVAMLAAIVLPILVIQPGALTKPMTGDVPGLMTHLEMAAIFASTSLLAGAVSLLAALATKRRGATGIIVATYTIVAPFTAMIVMSFISPTIDRIAGTLAQVLSLFNPVMAVSLGAATGRAGLAALLRGPLAASTVFVALSILLSRRLEF